MREHGVKAEARGRQVGPQQQRRREGKRERERGSGLAGSCRARGEVLPRRMHASRCCRLAAQAAGLVQEISILKSTEWQQLQSGAAWGAAVENTSLCAGCTHAAREMRAWGGGQAGFRSLAGGELSRN